MSGCFLFSGTQLGFVLPGANGVELVKINANALVEQVISSLTS
jgi:hypothetical protein